MGRFLKEKVKTPAQRFEALIERAEFNAGNSVTDSFLMALKKMKSQNDTIVIRPVELCLDVLEEIVFDNTTDFHPKSNYYLALIDAEKMYKDIFVFDEETDNFETLRLIFIEMFTKNNIYINKMFDLALFNSFEDKRKYVTLCQAIIAEPGAKEVFNDIKDYGLAVREYMLNDDMFLGNLVKVAVKMARKGARTSEEIIQEELEAIKHMNGIYNVDPVSIAKVEQNLSDAKRIIAGGADIIKQTTIKTEEMRRLTENFEGNIKEIEKRETDIIEAKLSQIKTELTKILDEYTDAQKKSILAEKDLLVKQVYSDAQAELDKYKAMARTVTASASLELANLNRDAESVLKRISNMVNDDAEVKKLLAQAQADKEFIDKVNKLNLLNDKNIEVIGKQLESVPNVSKEAEADKAAQAQSKTTPTAQAQPAQNNVMAADGMSAAATANFSSGNTTQYVVNNGDMIIGEIYEEDKVVKPINPLLDPAIPFKKRYETVMKEKQRREANGEHFHSMFDDVLIAVMENSNPYLIGPSGCGKTFMVKQISQLLNMEFIDIGYINEEYEILGFQTATGKYSRPNFYRCYKYGMIAFCDELDNGNSRATVKLNSFLSNNIDGSYSFPNGENVKRHGNFRIIAAGNTEGNGADANYNTREKIEESVQQRFVPMYIDYDNEVERAILKGYDDWYEFVVLFRAATDAWATSTGAAAQGILTTRDTQRVKQYLDNGSFDMNRIVKYEFVQTKDMEYLAYLTEYMNKNIGAHQKAATILKCFAAQVQELRKKGRH